MIKRLLDISLAIIGLIAFSPLLVGTYALVRIKMGKPVFFRQKRAGLNGKPFYIIKFRTMNNASHGDADTLDESYRITPLGQVLRSWSLDELPELWNVVKGEMSLVGPRPLLMEYLPLYSARQFRRHEMKPGITGWAQINGRNAITWERKFELDLYYVEHQSFIFDLRILGQTLSKVICQRDIGAGAEPLPQKFKGNRD